MEQAVDRDVGSEDSGTKRKSREEITEHESIAEHRVFPPSLSSGPRVTIDL